MAQVVYTGASEGASGSLFSGQKFWLSATVPQKLTIRDYIQSNGGVVVPLEKCADIILVDHLKKIQPHNSFSYRYVEQSVRKGKLEELDDHRCGPRESAARPAGSLSRPGKSTRTPFTAEDDRVLCDWVGGHQQRSGGTAGNEIYKQLETHNNRHPWQSWRDRWVSRFRNTNLAAAHTVPVPANAPPTPPNEQPEPQPERAPTPTPTEQHARQPSPRESQADAQPEPDRESKEDSEQDEAEYQEGFEFSSEDEEYLLELGKAIYNFDPAQEDEAWVQVAQPTPHHTPKEWCIYWHEVVKEIYLDQKRQRRDAGETSSQEDDHQDNELQDRDGEEAGEDETREIKEEILTNRREGSRSPSYHSDSSSYNTGRKEVSQDVANASNEASYGSGNTDSGVLESIEHRLARNEDQGIDLPPTPAREVFRSPKRKRSQTADTVTQSSPSASVLQHQKVKKPRLDSEIGVEREAIPSTPQTNVIELSDNDDECSDDEDEEMEAEFLLGASPSLSEPDYYYQNKIDLQIFNEIASSMQASMAADQEPRADGNRSADEESRDGDDESDVELTHPAHRDNGNIGDDRDDGDDEGDWAPTYVPLSIRDQSQELVEDENDDADSQLFLPLEEIEEAHSSSTKATVAKPAANYQAKLSPFRSNQRAVQTSSLGWPQSSHQSGPPTTISSKGKPPANSLFYDDNDHDLDTGDEDDDSGDEDGDPFPKEQTQAEIDAQLEAWVSKHMSEGVGFGEIEKAIRASCGVPDLASRALQSLLKHHKLPDDVAGIWTEVDDEDSTSFSHSDRLRVVRKHGGDRWGQRKMFLEEYDNDH